MFFCPWISLIFPSPDLLTTSCTAGVSTGPVGRTAGGMKGELDNTTFEVTGFNVVLGVEKTFPLLNNVSKHANCSVHLLFIKENCSTVTNVDVEG